MSRTVGWACLSLVVSLMLIQPLVAPHDPMRTDPRNAFHPPSGAHLLGTDGVGRDVLARLVAGAWRSLAAGLVAVSLSTFLGAAAGLVAGTTPGWVARAVTTLVDVLLAFPRFLLLLNLAAVVPLRSVALVGVLIGLTSWMRTARLVRTEVLSLRARPFVDAARAAGVGTARLLAHHLGPHVGRLVLESAGLRFASVVLAAASLDFLGVGLPADVPTWGSIILEGRGVLASAPWIAIPAIVVLSLTSAGLALVGTAGNEGSVG